MVSRHFEPAGCDTSESTHSCSDPNGSSTEPVPPLLLIFETKRSTAEEGDAKIINTNNITDTDPEPCKRMHRHRRCICEPLQYTLVCSARPAWREMGPEKCGFFVIAVTYGSYILVP